MKVLAQRYSGTASAGTQSKYMFIVSYSEYRSKQHFQYVQGRDFRYLRGM